MNIIITGATSFLGQTLSGRLSGRGKDDSCILFRHSFAEAPERLPQRADAWVHFAWGGVGSAGRSDRVQQAKNVEMSMAALQKAAQLSCSRFLFAGSQAEYGDAALSASGLQEETAECRPKSEYGKAKLLFGQQAASWAARYNAGRGPEERLRLIHMRIFSVYGNGDHPGSLLESCLHAFAHNERMEFGACTQDWDYLYIEEAVRAIEGLLDSETAEGIYNIASGDIRPLRAYIEELHALFNSRSALCFGARGDNAEGAVSLRPSLSRLHAETGFVSRVSFAEGIRKMRGKGE